MSLINDALKRARESQQNNPPRGAAPLMPVEPTERGFNWILPALVVLLIAAACFFIGLSMAKRPAAKIANAPEMGSAPKIVDTPKFASAPTIASTPATPATQQVESVAVIMPQMPTNTEAPAPPLNVVTPIKVQGIMFDPAQPWAIVNRHHAGRTGWNSQSRGTRRIEIHRPI